MILATLERLLTLRQTGQPAALATVLSSGDQYLLAAGEIEGPLTLDAATVAAIQQALTDDKSQTIETPLGAIFIEVWNPPLRLIVIGAVHIAQMLVPIAALAGYTVTVVDPRTHFATEARFPRTAVVSGWPDEEMTRLAPDRRTAVVALTHDPKLDDPALRIALSSEAFYVGALGSRRTHAKRVERLREAGLRDDEVARIRAPVGLAIGALSQAEIAVSILAEMTAVLRRAALGRREAMPA